MTLLKNPLIYSFVTALLLTAGRELFKYMESDPWWSVDTLLIVGFGIAFIIFKWTNRNKSFVAIATTTGIYTILFSILLYEMLKLALLQETPDTSYFTYRLIIDAVILIYGIGALIVFLLPFCLIFKVKETPVKPYPDLIDDEWTDVQS